MLFQGSMEGSLDHQQTQEEEMAFVEGNKLFFRPTSCDLGLFAICTVRKKRAEDRGGTPLVTRCPCPGGTQPPSRLDHITSVAPWPRDSESPFVPTLCPRNLTRTFLAQVGSRRLMTELVFLMAANGHRLLA